MTELDRVKAFIDSELTAEQRAVCGRDGSFVVRACPGSGKTRTVAARLALGIATWGTKRTGITALSFTNIAADEITAMTEEILGRSVRWPHRVATIDSFVNDNIIYPYGHIALGIDRRPEIVLSGRNSSSEQFVNKVCVRSHEDQKCRQKGCQPTDFIIGADGELRWAGRGDDRREDCDRDHCRQLKKRMPQAGFLLPSDAMYFAGRILANIPGVAEALAHRFPMIIIDEAQDTSASQFKIIRIFADLGCDIVLVGDPDQAIYEWNEACPDVFNDCANGWGCLSLTGNFRSSMKICNATHRFSSLDECAVACGDNKECDQPPRLIVYEPNQISELPELFHALTTEAGAERTDAVIVARKWSTLRKAA